MLWRRHTIATVKTNYSLREMKFTDQICTLDGRKDWHKPNKITYEFGWQEWKRACVPLKSPAHVREYVKAEVSIFSLAPILTCQHKNVNVPNWLCHESGLRSLQLDGSGWMRYSDIYRGMNTGWKHFLIKSKICPPGVRTPAGAQLICPIPTKKHRQRNACVRDTTTLYYIAPSAWAKLTGR